VPVVLALLEPSAASLNHQIWACRGEPGSAHLGSTIVTSWDRLRMAQKLGRFRKRSRRDYPHEIAVRFMAICCRVTGRLDSSNCQKPTEVGLGTQDDSCLRHVRR
jgi:hypothetical protein